MPVNSIIWSTGPTPTPPRAGSQREAHVLVRLPQGAILQPIHLNELQIVPERGKMYALLHELLLKMHHTKLHGTTVPCDLVPTNLLSL